MKTATRKSVRVLTVLTAVIITFALFGVFSLTLNAAAATDISVKIDTGAIITLTDADSNGFYDISSADQLYAFALAVKSGYDTINGELTANIKFQNNKTVLNNDGTLNGDGSDFRKWLPIGTYTKPFKGSFDGNDYTISGLYVNDSGAWYVGLFGYVAQNSNNTIQNVGVEDSYIRGNRCVGGVIGYNSATVVNCYNAGTIIGTAECTGGVIGSNDASSAVTLCYNKGVVSGDNTVGGVVGKNNGSMTKCYNTGTLNGNNYVGGIAGENYGTVTVCYNTGKISGNRSMPRFFCTAWIAASRVASATLILASRAALLSLSACSRVALAERRVVLTESM